MLSCVVFWPAMRACRSCGWIASLKAQRAPDDRAHPLSAVPAAQVVPVDPARSAVRAWGNRARRRDAAERSRAQRRASLVGADTCAGRGVADQVDADR